MSLLKRDVNPLNVLDMRRLTFIPPHFSCMSLTLESYWDDNVKKIDQWVYENLNSRYCLKAYQKLNHERKIVSEFILGVEEPKELTLFNLKCPHVINK